MRKVTIIDNGREITVPDGAGVNIDEMARRIYESVSSGDIPEDIAREMEARMVVVAARGFDDYGVLSPDDRERCVAGAAAIRAALTEATN